MYKERSRGTWRVHWTVDGKRRTKSFKSREDAKVFEGQVIEGIEVDSPAPMMTFKEFAERWIVEYCQVEKAENQWFKDQRMIERYLLPAFGETRLRDLRKRHLAELKAKLRLQPIGRKKKRTGPPRTLSPKTVNIILGTAKKMLGTAVDWDLLELNQFAVVKPLKVAEGTFDFWTLGEFDEFRKKATRVDPDFVRFVTVAFHTGLRLGELGGLKRDDLDFERRQIRVRATLDTNNGKRYERTKNRKIGFVPMNVVVRDALQSARFLQGDEEVFSRRLSWNARHTLHKLATLVGVRSIRFHDLRHSFASNLAAAGVDLMLIQRLMRHQSYQMTLRYAHLHPAQWQNQTEVLCLQNEQEVAPEVLDITPTRCTQTARKPTLLVSDGEKG